MPNSVIENRIALIRLSVDEMANMLPLAAAQNFVCMPPSFTKTAFHNRIVLLRHWLTGLDKLIQTSSEFSDGE